MKFPYWYLLLVPICLYYLGGFFNVGTMAINHGQMPVLIPQSLLTPDLTLDDTHSIMSAKTHLKFFCDWINVGDGIASPGDILIWLSESIMRPCAAIWAALIIRDKNKFGE